MPADLPTRLTYLPSRRTCLLACFLTFSSYLPLYFPCLTDLSLSYATLVALLEATLSYLTILCSIHIASLYFISRCSHYLSFAWPGLTGLGPSLPQLP